MTDKTKRKTDAAPARWVVMVYLAGDNNLSEEMIWALDCLQAVAGPEFDLFAQFDPSGPELATRYFDFKDLRAKSNKSESRPVLLTDEDISTMAGTGSRTALAQAEQFVSRCVTRAQRSAAGQQLRYMLVLSGHGGGPTGEFLIDEDPETSLTTRDLEDLMIYTKRLIGSELDILGLDACLMSTGEVCRQLQESVQWLVASEGFERMSGWPYDRMLQSLKSRPTMSPRQFVFKIFDAYMYFYTNYLLAGVSVDLSVTRLERGRMDFLVSRMRSLCKALIACLDDAPVCDSILLAHWECQSYKWEQYVDLWDFCDRLEHRVAALLKASRIKRPDRLSDLKVDTDHLPNERNMLRSVVVASCRDVQRAIVSRRPGEGGAPGLVRKCRHSGPIYQHSHGISLFFPWRHIPGQLDDYQQLKFCQETGWPRFLEAFLQKTVRAGREPWEQEGREARPVYPGQDPKQLVKTSPPHNIRVGSPHNLRVGSPHNSRVGNPHQSRLLEELSGSMKNPPAYYYPNEYEFPRKG